MTSMQGSHLKSILIIILISPSEGKTEIGDYIVDCSACNSVPVQGISSYSCKIRCDLQGEVNPNLTSLYDMLAQMFDRQTSLEAELAKTKQEQLETKQELVETKEKLEETERKLNETVEKLKIDVAFTVHLSNRQTLNAGATVVFYKIISNIGNGYDSTSGFFTVSHNGTYDLTLKTMTLKDAQMYTYLLINEEILCTSYVYGKNLQGICTVVRKLVEGDQAWAKPRDTLQYNNGGFSSLAGHLVHLN